MVNLKIPVHRFSIGLPYPEVPGVQKPLQEIFRWYINSLLSILEMIKEEGEIRARTDRNHTHITETLESIDIESRNLIIHSNNYIRALGLATQDERRYQAKRQRVLQVTVEQPAFIKGQETTISFDSSVRLGSGSFGVVYKVHERSTGAIFARKYIPLFKEGRINLEDRDIEHEVAVTQKLRHRHIVTIPFHFKNFEENAFDIFMSPAAECNLKELLEKADKPQPLFYPWFSFLLDALAHVHDQFIIHNDIKPGNILIRDDQPYISDFGISKDWTKAEGNFVPFRQRYGTRGYRAPELPEGDSEPQTSRSVAPTELTDIFALGCTFSEMLTIAVGKSINEYEEIRNNRNFRDCLVEVSRWIHALKDENNHLAHIMVGEISKMIAAQAKERGRAWDYVQSLANYTGAYR
jgi:serine/threonine protein kinase